jgi:hypothetical protein
MAVSQNKTVELTGFLDFKIIMGWESYEDLDLLVVYKNEDQQLGVVYFNDSGSANEHPHLSFQNIEFSSLEVENQEIVVVSQMKVQQIWIFGWAFEYMLESDAIDFADNGLHLKIANQEKSFQTSSDDLGIGNLCRLGVISKDAQGVISFTNHSVCFTVRPFQEIEEIFSYL